MAWLMAPVLWQTKQCFRSQSSPASASHESSVIARCPNIKLLTFPRSFSYVAKHLSSIKLSVGWWIVFAQSPFGCLGLGKLGLQMMGGKTYLWPLCIPRCTTKSVWTYDLPQILWSPGPPLCKDPRYPGKKRQSVAQNYQHIYPISVQYIIMNAATVCILFRPIRYCLSTISDYPIKLHNYLPSMQMQYTGLLLAPPLVTHNTTQRVETEARKKQEVQLEGKLPQKRKDFFHAKAVDCWWWQA